VTKTDLMSPPLWWKLTRKLSEPSGARRDRPLTEVDLIHADAAGDADAFEQLVRSYDHNVLRMAYNLLHSEEDARDVYRKFSCECTGPAEVPVRLQLQHVAVRIVANLCLDQIRKRKVRKEKPRRLTPGPGRSTVSVVREQRADVDPQRQVMSRKFTRGIQEILGSFTPRERVVFEMRHYQGMRLRSIGTALGVTEEAAKNCFSGHAEDAGRARGFWYDVPRSAG